MTLSLAKDMSLADRTIGPSLWELSHPDGSSIFVKQALDTEASSGLVFGPFLFLSAESLAEFQGTHGPMGLLRPLNGALMRAQQVGLAWVVESAREGFEPDNPDCIVLGDVLIPMTATGAIVADIYINKEQEHGEPSFPWTSIIETHGESLMRFLNAGLVEKMVLPMETN